MVGIDVAAGMVAGTTHTIRVAGLTQAHVALMDAGCLDFPDCTFDRVLSGFTLHMLPEPAAALSEIFRVLTPRGDRGLFPAGTPLGPSEDSEA